MYFEILIGRTDEPFQKTRTRSIHYMYRPHDLRGECARQFQCALHESATFTRRARGRPRPPHDAGGKSVATRESSASDPAPESSCLRLVERSLTRRGRGWHY